MKPCPAEAAAVACEHLAAALDRGAVDDRYRTAIAATVYWVPNTHPMRSGADDVLLMARAIEAGEPKSEELRAFAVKLREGAPEMRRTGWWPMMHGEEEP